MLKVLSPITSHATLVASQSKQKCVGLTKKMLPVFFKKKEILLPTLLGCYFIGCLITFAIILFWINLNNFLVLNKPIKADVLVVEGWSQDYALKSAAHEFKKGNYTYVLSIGGPLQKGSQLSHYKNMAEICTDILIKNGVPAHKIVPLAHPDTPMNRTFASTIEVKNWLNKNTDLLSINILSVGAHSRRSYALFKKNLPQNIKIGIIAVKDNRYDSKKWWSSSDGARTVITESIAYFYSLFL